MIFLNIGSITEKFELLSSIEEKDIPKWLFLINDACSYVYSKVKKKNLSEDEISRLDFLCAVYACRIYLASIPCEPTSFAAGDLKITSSAARAEKIEELWKENLKLCSDIIKTDNFLFGAVCV